MTIDKAIKHAEEVAEEKEKQAWESQLQEEYEKIKPCKKCAEEHRQLAEWLKDYKRLLEQEPCEDEYIKVPKKALKYRTAGMVAYNAEWLKNHFDIERAVICGAQESCEDVMAIHTQGLDEGIRCAMCTNSMKSDRGCDGGCVVNEAMYKEVMNTIRNHIVPPVTPTRKTGKWIAKENINGLERYYKCSNCEKHCLYEYIEIGFQNAKTKYCPNCGAEMGVEE